MYECLKDGGIMITAASNHWKLASGKKEKDFSLWLLGKQARIIEIEPGRFKESGTMVGACIIGIHKNLGN
jgi:hypothetical protein